MRFPIATNADNESWGEHDPSAAFAAHDPTREPWANMTREQLLEAQAKAQTAAEFDMIQEFIFDGMSTKELKTTSHAHSLATFLIQLWNSSGDEQAKSCVKLLAECPRKSPTRCRRSGLSRTATD